MRLRTLVVDDSVAFRTALVRALSKEPTIEVVGEAGDGEEAVFMNERLKPDVISMDVIMPRCTGIEAAQRILRQNRVPIVLLSTMSRLDEQWMALNALRLGVIEVSNKPVLVGPQAADDMRDLVRVLHNAAAAISETPSVAQAIAKDNQNIPRPKTAAIIAVGSSTGGPAALERILGGLHANPPPVVIAQHLAPNLGASLGKWLSGALNRPVHRVEKSQPLEPGCIYLAGDRVNIEVFAGGLRPAPTFSTQHVAPNVNVLFNSVTKHYGAHAAGIVLTGMGSDGAEGLKSMRKARAWTAAQDKETSVVYGMPLAAHQHGSCQEVLSLDGLREALGTIQFEQQANPR